MVENAMGPTIFKTFGIVSVAYSPHVLFADDGSNVLIDSAKQAPALVVLVFFVILFLKFLRDERKSRDENTRESQREMRELVESSEQRFDDLARDTFRTNKESADACHAAQRESTIRYQQISDQNLKVVEKAIASQQEGINATKMLERTLQDNNSDRKANHELLSRLHVVLNNLQPRLEDRR